MKKLKLFGIITVLLLAAAVVAGCSNAAAEYKNNLRVVYELEGGVYGNSTRPVDFYYNYARGGEYAIGDIEKVSNKKVTRTGYFIEGWYTQRTETDGVVTYDGKWDFEKDKVTFEADGKVSYGGKTGDENLVRLYACWATNVSYEYNVGYVDDNGSFVKLATVETLVDIPFGEEKSTIEKKELDKREGYTSLGRYYKYDAAAEGGKGEELTDDFVLEQSKEDVSLDIVADYIKGDYRVVREAKDITSNASVDKKANRMLYLMNDVDFGGATVDFKIYNGIKGNGHKLSNFTIRVIDRKTEGNFDGSENYFVEVSMFGDIDGGEITDVTVENVSIGVRAQGDRIRQVYFAPLCMRAKNAKLANVTFTATKFVVFSDHELSDADYFKDSEFVYYTKDDGTVVSGCTFSVCEKTEGTV